MSWPNTICETTAQSIRTYELRSIPEHLENGGESFVPGGVYDQILAGPLDVFTDIMHAAW